MLNSLNTAPPRLVFDELCVTALFCDGQSNSFWFVPTERLERSPEVEDYTLNFEESVMSSHTATDDEIDFRMILPSESHRLRSLGTTGRRGSLGSDQGTVSYSSVSDIRFYNLLNFEREDTLLWDVPFATTALLLFYNVERLLFMNLTACIFSLFF